MRGKLSAGALVALAALLIPAAPATAQTTPSGLDKTCKTVERKVYKDFRKLVTIDVDTATDIQVRVQATQLYSEAKAESLPVLTPRLLDLLKKNVAEDLRAFLKTDLRQAWTTDLRISVVRTLTDAGPKVKAATQQALDNGSIDVYLAYLNDGVYAARALDCATKPPTVPPTVKPSVTPSASPVPAAPAGAATPGGSAGGLPVTGTETTTVAAAGAALLLLGAAGYLLARRRRSHFTA